MNIPVAVLIWLMIVPMLLKVDFSALHQVANHWKGIGVTLFINWGVKPFSMALLGWICIGVLFAPYLPHEHQDSYIAGLILLSGRPLYGHGVCLESPFKWGAKFHVHSGGGQRSHHDCRLCPHCRIPSGIILHYGPLEYFISLGGIVHCASGDFCPHVAAKPYSTRGRTRGQSGTHIQDAAFFPHSSY